MFIALTLYRAGQTLEIVILHSTKVSDNRRSKLHPNRKGSRVSNILFLSTTPTSHRF